MTYHRFPSALAAAVGCLCLALVAHAQIPTPPNYTNQWSTAINDALSQGKFIMLVSGTPGCGNCVFVEDSTFAATNPPVHQLVQEALVYESCNPNDCTDWQAYTQDYPTGGWPMPLVCLIDPQHPSSYLWRNFGSITSSQFYNSACLSLLTRIQPVSSLVNGAVYHQTVTNEQGRLTFTNVYVASASFLLNSQGWSSAASADHRTWSFPIGTLNTNAINTIQEYARSSSGGRSLTNTVSFVYNPNPQLRWLLPPGNETIYPTNTYSRRFIATNDGLPASAFRYQGSSCLPNLTVGADGTLTWPANPLQAPGTYIVSLTATETNGIPQTSISTNFSLTIPTTNLAPHLTCVPNPNINEGVPWSYQAVATSSNGAASLRFYLKTGAPAGLGLTTSGLFTWTPTEEQGPGTYTVSFYVSDNGTPPLSSTNQFQIQVNEVNTSPTLAPLSDRTITVGTTLNVTNSASDNDAPINTLTFAPVNAPPDATLGSADGIFSWRPKTTFANTTNTITVRVSDNGRPSMSATQIFRVTVSPLNPVRLTLESASSTNAVLAISGCQSGPDYHLVYSTNLASSDWKPLLTTNLTGPSLAITNRFTASEARRYYRVLVGP
jgi:hypothetical protein